MTVFISYSHNDKQKIEEIAQYLIMNKAHVWIDRWELNVGDSILNRVEEKIEESGALLIMLSKSSVKSEWCKKELTAGLMRELHEKRVVVLPVLLEDCKIPLFLRDKMYADFRTDFNSGLQDILDGIAKVINADQGRSSEDNEHYDWSIDWGYHDDIFSIRFTIAHCVKNLPLTFLTEIRIICDKMATQRYKQYEDAGLDWMGRDIIASTLFYIGKQKDIRIHLESQLSKEIELSMVDPKTGMQHCIHISSRKLGEDNGKDQLLDISDYLKMIEKHIQNISRNLTEEEEEKMKRIMSSQFNA